MCVKFQGRVQVRHTDITVTANHRDNVSNLREVVKTSSSELFPNTSDTPISEAVSEHLDREYC